MSCEHYQNALIEAAASSIEPQGELRAHLAACVDCRAAFAQEQALFSSIDAGLHVTANADVPASLLSRARARLYEAVAPQRPWIQPLIFAVSSAALAFAIFLFARPHHSRPENQAKQTPQIPVNETPVTNARHQNSGPDTQIVSSNKSSFQKAGHSTLLRPVAFRQPEVLVPPDEREAFTRFVATLQEHDEVAVALVIPSTDEKGEPVSLQLLRIDRLEVKPLEGTEFKASDGVENIP